MIDNINPSYKTISILLSSLILGFFSSYRLNIFVIFLSIIFTITSKRADYKQIIKVLIPIIILSFSFFMAGFKYNAKAVGGETLGADSMAYRLENGLMLGTRIGAFGLLGLCFSQSTDKNDLIYSFIQQLKMPNEMGYGILSAINLIPNLKEDLEKVKLSYEIRGVKTNFLSMKPIFTLLVRSVRFSDNIASAMEAKAFGPNRTYYKTIKVRPIDYVFLLGFPLLILVLGIVSKIY